jgi:hypothetical protein
MYLVHQFVIDASAHSLVSHSPHELDFERYAGWEFVRWLDATEDGKLYKRHINLPVSLELIYNNDSVGVKVFAPLTQEQAVFFELIKTND